MYKLILFKDKEKETYISFSSLKEMYDYLLKVLYNINLLKFSEKTENKWNILYQLNDQMTDDWYIHSWKIEKN